MVTHLQLRFVASSSSHCSLFWYCSFLFLIISQHQEAAAADIGLPNCDTKCGDMDIPYPFGKQEGCYLDQTFEVTCTSINNNHTSSAHNASTSAAYLPGLQLDADSISVSNHLVRVAGHQVHHFHLNKSPGENISTFPFNISFVDDEYFRVSATRNVFIAVGCDVNAYLFGGVNEEFLGACASLCTNHPDVPANHPGLSSCSGFGCCQTNLSTSDAQNVTLWVETMDNNPGSGGVDSPCGFLAFVDTNFLPNLSFPTYSNNSICNTASNYDHVPLILEWKVGNRSCEDAKNTGDYACGENTDCRNSSFGTGYQCSCINGYTGNPYLPRGCEDIDECKAAEGNRCPPKTRCVNNPGSYSCLDTRRSLLLPILGTCLATGLLVILVAICFWIHRRIKKINERTLKQRYFKRNGGLLLQQHISSSSGSTPNELKLITIDELKKATDNFSISRILGKGGLGTVYKGMLSDGSIAAIKIANVIDESQVGQFINEVFILSQIKHRHIIRLLGCCLETEVPLLVYEYVSNGTLDYHLHQDSNSVISWENRLRIAVEISGALAYLHSYATMAIFHRDIKSSNILQDENYRAIVSDFGLSRSVSVEKTHLTTMIGGTFGYLDPEYFRSGKLNDKADVYAFGVVLAELLTGRKAICFMQNEESLAVCFRNSVKENCLPQILDQTVADEALDWEIYAATKLCNRCLKLNSQKRPSMKDVAAELDRLISRRTNEPVKHQECFLDDFSAVKEGFDSYSNDNSESEDDSVSSRGN